VKNVLQSYFGIVYEVTKMIVKYKALSVACWIFCLWQISFLWFIYAEISKERGSYKSRWKTCCIKKV